MVHISKRSYTLVAFMMLIAISLSIASQKATAGTIFQDDFASATLDSAWTIIRNDPTHWSLTANPGALRIISQLGEFFLSPKPLNVFLVDPQAEYSSIETLVTFNPSQDFQQAGLVIYVDDANYIKFERLYASNVPGFGPNMVEFYDETTKQHFFSTVSAQTLYLKIVKIANDYTASYSTDGITYVNVGTITATTLTTAQVGLYAENGNRVAPDIPADFDFFVVRSPAPTYTCIGFEPPLDDPNTPVVVKKRNRALPFKAELVDENGAVVTDTTIAAPPVIQVSYTAVTGGTPIDISDETVPVGLGTNGNQFVFTEEGKWQFNLKLGATSAFSTPGTYRVSMQSGNDYAINPTCMAQFVIE